jgi:hypothetical protein
MLLSKLTPGTAKPLTRPEKVLPTGPPVQQLMVDHLASTWFYTLGAFQDKPRCLLAGLLPGCLPHRQRWVTAPRSGLTTWYIHRETQTVIYHAKGTHDISRPQESVSRSAQPE